MTIVDFLNKLKRSPGQIAFSDTMAVIESNYQYTPTAFSNGDVENATGTNEGSCKLFAFAQLHKLDQASTLACFGDYYRKDVLENPDGSDHANIRNFIKYGWEGIAFQGEVLSLR